MNLAAVIVHHGDARVTETLISRLRFSPIIVILHDAFELSRAAGVDWIEAENRGYAAGLNSAAHHVLQTYGSVRSILALNPDIDVDSKTLEALYLEHQSANADCTFPVLREKGHLIHGYRFSRFGTLKSAVNPEWYSGACFIFKIDAWQQVGGFDESYFHYFEDRDFCLRLRSAGFRLHQPERIVIEHQSKSGVDYPGSKLPKFAVRNHLIALERSNLLDPMTFLNVITRHFLYLFRWRRGWRGIPKWLEGIKEFLTDH